MSFADFFIYVGIIPECQEAFFQIAKRESRNDFEEKVQVSIQRIKESDESFGEFLPGFAEEEHLTAEELNLYIYLRILRETYEDCKNRGIPDEVFIETAESINANARGCKTRYGMYGVPQKVYREWLRIIVLGKLYSLNNGFKFEIRESDCEGEFPGGKVNIGDTVISIHIPSGFKLEKEAFQASIEDARVFFGRYFGMKNVIFRCCSWLMHPWLRDALPEGSRILDFQNSFTILKSEENLEEVMSWVFRGYSEEDLSALPADTSLRRACIENLKNNVPMGLGYGFRI